MSCIMQPVCPRAARAREPAVCNAIVGVSSCRTRWMVADGDCGSDQRSRARNQDARQVPGGEERSPVRRPGCLGRASALSVLTAVGVLGWATSAFAESQTFTPGGGPEQAFTVPAGV